MASGVALVYVLMEVLLGHIHLAAEDGLEGQVRILALEFVDIVEVFLDAEHIAVVGDGQAGHAVGYGLVDKRRDGRLPVKERIL